MSLRARRRICGPRSPTASTGLRVGRTTAVCPPRLRDRSRRGPFHVAHNHQPWFAKLPFDVAVEGHPAAPFSLTSQSIWLSGNRLSVGGLAQSDPRKRLHTAATNQPAVVRRARLVIDRRFPCAELGILSLQ